MNKTGLVYAGNFPRLTAHTGFGHGWFNRWMKGDLPPIDYLIGVSSGALAGSIITQWDEDDIINGEEILIYLKRGQFASLNPKIRNSGGLALATTLAIASSTHKIRNPYLRLATNLGLISGALYLDVKFFKDLFHAESFFVYNNLFKLLRKLNMDKVMNSKVNFEAAAVDINMAGWIIDELFKDPFNLNGWVSVTNFKPEHKGNVDLLMRGIANSARIWAFFNPEKTAEGHSIVDGAALSNIPIHFAVKNDCDTIVVPYYNCPIEGPSDIDYCTWVKILQRCSDLTVSSNTSKTIRGYIRVNRDLEQLSAERKVIDNLERFINQTDADSTQKDEIQTRINSIREIQKKYSFYNKKRVNLVVVSSDPLPNINFGHFTKDDQVRGINLGYKALEDSLSEIVTAIKNSV